MSSLPSLRWLLVVPLLGCLACGGGSGAPPAGGGAVPLLAAGSTKLDPVAGLSLPEVDLARLGLGAVDAVYDVTTPAGEPLVFDVLFRGDGNEGPVRVSVAHAEDGGLVPVGGPETLAGAGLLASGPGSSGRGAWIDATGDGFSRLTVRGSVEDDQVLAIQGSDGDGTGTALVRIRIGDPSAVNSAADTRGDYPGILGTTTLYSSDSWLFGLPTAAVSGDRTSVVVYEGDRSDQWNPLRYEMRLQVEAGSGLVTGGASDEPSTDSGNWRDHEIAALYNVLALAHAGADQVTLKVSFDRGATFGQVESFNVGPDGGRARLVQVAMAVDYSLALLYWRSNPDASSDLVLVTGAPSAVDGVGSPTAFAFDPPVVVFHDPDDVTPMLMDAAWSEEGDLVIGYAFTRFRTLPDMMWETLTQNRCAVMPWGGALRDGIVEEDLVVGKDPSVALVGGGADLRIYYAYEAADGVRLRTSADAGLTWSAPVPVGDPSAHLPSVFVRPGTGGDRVDVLHLAWAADGLELHLAHWDPYDPLVPPEVHRLTRAVTEGTIGPGPVLPPGGGTDGNTGGDTGGGPVVALDEPLPPDGGYRITQVAWFGYDAALDGDEIVVVVDEETTDGYLIYMGLPVFAEGLPPFAGADGAAGGNFVPVEPPPFAPGLTEPLPAPDPAHRHQLKLIRLR